MLIIRSIQKSINQIDSLLDGWKFGQMVIEPEGIFIQQDDGSLITVPDGCHLEVLNGDQWQRLTHADLSRKTVEGWPAYAGLDARMRQNSNKEGSNC